jgi:hypothetical protein
MPNVLLHGSPHVDNYARSHQGAAMVDFDRSRVGPYAWDLVRLMVSMSLRQKNPAKGLLDRRVLQEIKLGYLSGFRDYKRKFSQVRFVRGVEPKPEELSTNAYLAAGRKWAGEMRRSPLEVNDPDVLTLVHDYAKQYPDLLTQYYIEEAGRGQGSMGFREIFLVVLAPKDPQSNLDRILLNIKQVRADPDSEWFKNPFETEIERMHTAAELYAPGWTMGPGSAMLRGVEYDVRQVPPFNVKIKDFLDQDDLEDFAWSVGSQLGRAHRLWLNQENVPADDLRNHLKQNFSKFVSAALVIRDEIVEAHKRYLIRMRREGTEPLQRGEDN